MRVKPLASIADKWASRAANAGQAYTDGINAAGDWATATADAASNYAAGVQAAVADGRFTKGVQATGTQGWKDGATKKGALRYGPGVSVSKDKFSKGFGPFAQVLSSLNLPGRLPKGDPQNVNRVQAVITALRNAKLGK